ncbi:CRISPR-associated endonuclease Cas2 [Roseateles sp.]|uniref:CRISPR-associated endonuclease Cas2 n=1 Tax=Roseateles sp. TaxID=1971397 RepID=UPI00286D393C|nr:CRISPR-associated endonuclease Cas2 [Roseateles sp.]
MSNNIKQRRSKRLGSVPVHLGAKTWLLAYDISDPKRLRQVHREVRRHGLAALYSAFVVPASDAKLADLLDELDNIIHDQEDDVRAYHLPLHCKVWRMGRGERLDGVHLDAGSAATLLLGAVLPVAAAVEADAESDWEEPFLPSET